MTGITFDRKIFAIISRPSILCSTKSFFIFIYLYFCTPIHKETFHTRRLQKTSMWPTQMCRERGANPQPPAQQSML